MAMVVSCVMEYPLRREVGLDPVWGNEGIFFAKGLVPEEGGLFGKECLPSRPCPTLNPNSGPWGVC
jgi:hypothetical protein